MNNEYIVLLVMGILFLLVQGYVMYGAKRILSVADEYKEEHSVGGYLFMCLVPSALLVLMICFCAFTYQKFVEMDDVLLIIYISCISVVYRALTVAAFVTARNKTKANINFIIHKEEILGQMMEDLKEEYKNSKKKR